MIRKAALAGLFALASISAAHAGPTETFAWTATFSDLGPANNDLTFTGSFSPQPYTITGGVNDSVTIEDYLAVHTDYDKYKLYSSDTDTIKVTFNFYKPGAETGTVNGTGTESEALFGLVSGGKITWKNGGSTDVNFADGAEIRITLDDATFGNIGNDDCADIDATVLIEKVPEPAAIALFGVGLLGLGMIATRRRGASGDLA
jgi:hypothetical protein